MKQLLISTILVSATFMSLAQPGWKWPEDVETAKENNALYVDAIKSKDFATAIGPHSWLLENCPDLNESLYINGSKIYEGLEKIEKDPEQKKAYQITALKMYDERIKYFGKEGKVLNRKAFTAYKYYKNERTKYGELMVLFDKTFELNGNKVLKNNLMAYMDVIRRFKKTGGEMTDEQILDKYGVISDIIAFQNAAKPSAAFETIQANVDKILLATVDVNCELLEGKFVPKMIETKEPKMAKKVFQLMLTAKCTDSPSFIQAAELVFDSEPDAGLAKVIAIKHVSAGNIDLGNEWYDKALGLTEDNLEKGALYLSKAQVYSNKGIRTEARSNARKALANDPSLKDAYTLIGNLYMQSYQDCRKGVSKVDDRLVFIAAYNQFAKAGNTKGMTSAKEQFPSISEMFELGLEEGQSMTVGCWINETVRLERRPN
ncbi:MAG: hypothetical protein JXR07_07015 [Reichenbachiella sp.]